MRLSQRYEGEGHEVAYRVTVRAGRTLPAAPERTEGCTERLDASPGIKDAATTRRMCGDLS